MVKFAANSILAKARALYGRRITPAEYNGLLNCRSVSEAANFLKVRTHYGSFFGGEAVTELHRGQIEAVLKKGVAEKHRALAIYERSVGREFYKFTEVIDDIDTIMTKIRLAGTVRPQDFILYLTVNGKEKSALDRLGLSEANTPEEIKNALKGTPYADLLRSYYSDPNAPESRLRTEAELMRYKYKVLDGIIKKTLRGAESGQVRDLFSVQSDLVTFINIYRIKKMPDTAAGLESEFGNPYFTKFGKDRFEKLVNAPDAAGLTSILAKTPYRRSGAAEPGAGTEDMLWRYFYGYCRKTIRFSTNPSAVMFCYYFLLENELKNIIHIIEGIRYGLHADQIRDILVGVDGTGG